MKIWKRIPATVAVLIVLICSFIVTEGTAVVIFRQMYSSSIDYSQVRYSRAIREHLSASLVNASSAAFALEMSGEFSEMFQKGDRAEMLRFFEPFCDVFQISYVNVVDKNGDIVLRSYMPNDFRHDSIAYQSGVKNALEGERFACFEKATIVKASARATAPIRRDGEVIGAVVCVFRFDTNEWADTLKDRYGIEVSVFSEDEGCIATTVVADGERAVGEPMSAAAAAATYGRGEEFKERAEIMGTSYASLYIPIQNPQGGTFVVLCVSISREQLIHETFMFTLICSIAAAAAVGLTGFVLTRHTSRLRRSKRELAATLEEANRANAAKSDFLARMSHEIRTPLNAIIGMTELILREKIPDSVRRDATVAKHAGKSLLEIINDILDISKIESGKMELVNVDYDVASVISDVMSMTRVRAGEKPIQIVTKIKPDFPAIMNGDETRVRQVLMNLMSNAVKYTNEGKITLCGEFLHDAAEERGGGFAVFSVKDTGIGIREEDMEKLFGAFAQVDTETNRKVEGTGLGLAITKTLAELMGGDVSFESEYGKGSVFTVRIRQGITKYKPIGDIPAAIAALESKSGMRGVRFIAPEASVLVVDDLEANLLVAEGLLAPYEVSVDTVSSGAEALEAIMFKDYDFVLMDHMMPGMDGMETTRRIRASEGGGFARLPIIALTANAVSGMREKFLENGFDGFLSKPIEPKELNKIMERWVPKDKQMPPKTAPEGAQAAADHFAEAGGLDIDLGIARCGGNAEVYRRVARSFAGDLKTKTEQLRVMCESGDFAACRELMHAIKGSSGNVGATEVFEMTKRLEEAVKDDAYDYVRENMPALIERCEAIAINADAVDKRIGSRVLAEDSDK